MKPSATEPEDGYLPCRQRSAVTNKRRLFVHGDGNSAWARRQRDLRFLYTNDIGPEATLSEFQLSLVSVASTLRTEIERLEGKLSLGEDVDLDLLGRLIGHFRRVCETLGIQRVKRDITPSLADIADEIETTREAAE